MSLRMFWHSRSIFLYFVLLTYALDSIDGSYSPKRSRSSNFIFRHRRSYERHKNKSTLSNSARANSDGSKPGVFATENCTVVVAQIGGTATLPCVVRKFNNGVVSWVRKHDYHLLTVGLATYNTDDRFMVEHVRHLQNWGLLIKKVQPSDAGLYECQMSTHPPSSIVVELKVTKALAEIQGSPDLHVHAGSQLRLVCALRDSTEPPEYVFWYHDRRMINYDPGVAVTEGRSSSVLQVREADKGHNGNYTCSPSNAVPASINVHVLNATAEEKPAAMQHANSSCSPTKIHIVSGVLLSGLLPLLPWT
ncbi:unnamed protein product [Phaedon cochleariae]|uniref:Ig-like domain-containing protein n=1 Tax=Phaedon cochleariae TaxID=80249 RepID=A0A9N9SC09_PHACE|nr:unnamed protein product [Phaedon cochleariae]